MMAKSGVPPRDLMQAMGQTQVLHLQQIQLQALSGGIATTGQLFTWYEDVDSGQWIEASTAHGNFVD